MTQASIRALERLSVEHMGTLGLHGLVDEQAEAFGKAIGAFFIEELQHGLEELRMIEVGHVWFWCWCFTSILDIVEVSVSRHYKRFKSIIYKYLFYYTQHSIVIVHR